MFFYVCVVLFIGGWGEGGSFIFYFCFFKMQIDGFDMCVGNKYILFIKLWKKKNN